jgi:hypothetical protein
VIILWALAVLLGVVGAVAGSAFIYAGAVVGSLATVALAGAAVMARGLTRRAPADDLNGWNSAESTQREDGTPKSE